MVVMSTYRASACDRPKIRDMQEPPGPRPNPSPEELRRDFRSSEPAGRIRQGMQLSRFGSRLRRAMLEARSSRSADS
jgi:hypothetical protein